MTSVSKDGERFNPVTGEIIDDVEADLADNPPAFGGSAPVPSTDVAVLPDDPAELAAYFAEPEPTPREVVAWIMGTADMAETDPEDAARSIMARILLADDVDDVLAASVVVHAQNILNVPLRLSGVKWQRSRMNEGSSCYAVISAVRADSDEKVTVTCSGRNVMIALVKFQMLGKWPPLCQIVQARKPTEAGYYPLWLEPA